MEYPKVSVIILNWNGWKDTIECLESLYRITYPNYDVIVVDNGSKDDSIQKIREYAEGKIKVNSKFFKYNPNNKPIKVFEINEDEARQGKFNRSLYEKYDPDRRLILIKNKRNYGFPEGNNIGIKLALSVLNPDYILLLNNDTVVDKKFLEELVKVAESNKGIGIVGPKIYFYDDPKRIAGTGEIMIGRYVRHYYDPTYGKLESRNQNLEPKIVDAVKGCALMIKKSAIADIGLLNPVYFATFEDFDLCFRCRKAGYLVYSVQTSKIFHKESVSFEKHEGKKPYLRYYLLKRNSILFAKKHKMLTNIIATLLYIFRTILISMFNRDLIMMKTGIYGIIDGFTENLHIDEFICIERCATHSIKHKNNTTKKIT